VTDTKPRPPTGTKASGKRLWESITAGYDLDEHELALLREAVRTVDTLDDLAAVVSRDGPMIDGAYGVKAHPALVEARQLKIALARLLAVLRLPAGDEGDHQAGARSQRRVGARGAYGVKTR
jgi:hypothetical protein